MKRLLYVTLAVLLSACSHDPIEQTKSNNPSVPVALLVTIEGCNVYRFEDGGYDRYVTICPNGNTSTAGSHHQGKVTKIDHIDTVWKK